MQAGVIQQTGRPQDVYDDPANLFVAKFLGTPPVNVFDGAVRDGMLWIGQDAVLPVKGLTDRPVIVGIRPEGFILQEDGPLHCSLRAVEVMGRDTSVVSVHGACQAPQLRSIISAESRVDTSRSEVRFAVKPAKTLLFDCETQVRLNVELG